MKSRQRPRGVTWLAFGVLILTSINLIRIYTSFQIPSFAFSVPFWYFPLTGALWGGIGLYLTIGLFLGRSWASTLTRWLSVVYAGWYWLDRLLFVKTDYAQNSHLAALVGTMISLALVHWILLKPTSKTYFKETSS